MENRQGLKWWYTGHECFVQNVEHKKNTLGHNLDNTKIFEGPYLMYCLPYIYCYYYYYYYMNLKIYNFIFYVVID